MRVVVQTDNIVITRCADPDDSVFMQVMAQPGINDWLQTNQVECWCESVGTFAPSQTVFAVAAFSRAQVEAIPQPRSEIELSDHTRERAMLESEPISAFGVRLCVTAAPAMGQVSFGLRELALDPAPPLDAVRGVAVLASVFLLNGDAAARLALPPPMSHGHFAGMQRENAYMKVWCGVGESVTSIACSDVRALPTVSQAALREAGLAPPQPPAAIVGSDDVVAVGVLFECCGATATKDDFEALSIQAFLHDPHTRQHPERAVPDFARRMAADELSVATARVRSDSKPRVSWMAKGKGM